MIGEELRKVISWLLSVCGATLLVICIFGAPLSNAIAGGILVGFGWGVGHLSRRGKPS